MPVRCSRTRPGCGGAFFPIAAFPWDAGEFSTCVRFGSSSPPALSPSCQVRRISNDARRQKEVGRLSYRPTAPQSGHIAKSPTAVVRCRYRPRAVFRRCDFNASKLSFSPAVETSTRRLRAGSLANPSRWCRSCLCRSCEPLADWLPPCCPPARLSRALREVSARGTIDLK
jgi:hypothetical protein